MRFFDSACPPIFLDPPGPRLGGGNKKRRIVIMKPNADKPEAKPGAKPESKDDLKSLPMQELQKKLGSTPDGLSQAEAAETADPIWT